MTNDERIEKDAWKFCKKVFKSENQVLPVFDEKICSDILSSHERKTNIQKISTLHRG